ncbi:DUF58 domain-containing protein [Bartonella choladocola]|uniref:DUF58 domain-containing protein n=1 Tax=Bartonella choladocola TaxID=2750995 RepID=A0A1U9MIN0_9HYPH|nr:DUF58 domain-containing protein [Bartonella choladocola]AQT47764.1 Protein of unknown function DUF58 [Bartonella choladocola]
MAIARDINVEAPTDLAVKARIQSAKLPDLLIEARHIANTLVSGFHGRRKRGNGDNFWQFRPYVDGEPVTRIDWRRSARDNHIYLRDQEWAAAQTIWILPDQSPSMHYQSRFSDMPKDSYAMLMALTLCELFSRSGERVAVPGLMAPTQSRNAAEEMALSFSNLKAPLKFGDFLDVSRHSHIILLSDFLDDPDTIEKKFGALANADVTAHFVEVCDPAEERFPYHGRVEFIDPESRQYYLAGRAETFQDAYLRLYKARRQSLADFANKSGASYHIAATDKKMSTVILELANLIGQAQGYRRG